MKKVFLEISKLCILLLFPLNFYSQEEKISESTSLRINYENYSESISFLPSQKQIKVQKELIYHWFDGIETHKTQGDYDKYLLHGNYVAYYLNRNISIKGSYKKGLKNNSWKYWNEDGVLFKTEIWNNGRLNGNVIYYNHNGSDSLEYHYKNGKIGNKAVIYLNYKKHHVKVERIDEFYNKQHEKDLKKNNRKNKKDKKPKESEKIEENSVSKNKRGLFRKNNTNDLDKDDKDISSKKKKEKKDKEISSKKKKEIMDKESNFWTKINPKNWFRNKNKM